MFFKLDRKTISDVSSRELVSNAGRPGMPAPHASRMNMAAPDYGVP